MTQSAESFLKHYGVVGMKWGHRRGSTLNVSPDQHKRNSQIYGNRGAKRINKAVGRGEQISTARGSEKTRRDRVMGKNKYVRQVGKLGGGAVGGLLGFASIHALGRATTTATGKAMTDKLLGQAAPYARLALNSLAVQGVIAAGAAKVGYMLAGDAAVGINMRAHGYDPNRR